jgi:uncharacterized membrane-anchored protein
MKKFLIGSSVATSIVSFAQIALAQQNVVDPNANITTSGLAAFFNQINAIINYIIPFIVGLAVLVVIYGVFGFISNAADEEARASAKQFIVWGILGIVIMLSVWGLVSILANTLNVQHTGAGVVVPTFGGGTQAL